MILSPNLLQNPSGQAGLQGWRQLKDAKAGHDETMPWMFEMSTLPVNATTNTNFVSSNRSSVMFQVVALKDFLKMYDSRSDLPAAPIRLGISTSYMGRMASLSLFKMQATLTEGIGLTLWARPGPSLLVKETPVLAAKSDSWERASLEMEIPPSWLLNGGTGKPNMLLFISISGQEFLSAGTNGTGVKVANVSVNVLGSPDVVSSVMI
jgi:hypothetical protein